MKKQMKKSILVIICMLAAGICYSCSFQKSAMQEPELILEQGAESKDSEMQTMFEEVLPEESLSEIRTESLTEPETETKPCVYVHVCGEVVSPGVYEMEEGSRVFQAVEMAGGFLDEASGEYLNMAQIVEDGMKIMVPSKEDIESGKVSVSTVNAGNGQAEAAEPVVNLNTADKEQLMTLKGIGESRAEDILRYREEHGKFRNIEEIMNVPGIKDAAFQKIKDRIIV